MSDASTQRNALRSQLKKNREALSADDRSDYSQRICKQAIPLLEGCTHIAFYYRLGAEVDLTSLMLACEQAEQHCYVPIVQPHNLMRFAPVHGNTSLIANQYGIKEPNVSQDELINATQLDAVIVPLVGFDDQCNRMGMGGGYYDRCFAHRKAPLVGSEAQSPLLIGVAYEVQHATSVFAQGWDVPLDHVITEKRVITRT